MAISRLRTGTIGVITSAGIAALALTTQWEGLKLYSYPDIIGVWTACYGETRGIHKRMKFTKKQCDSMIIDRLIEHETGMRACLKTPDTIPQNAYVAFTSLTYNIGIGAFCKSTLRSLINLGDIRGACTQILKWNRAGGRVVNGLVNRRVAEYKLCMQGL